MLEQSLKFRIRLSLLKFERWPLEDSRRPSERLGENQVRNSPSMNGGNLTIFNDTQNLRRRRIIEWI
jgi:hypothetical protein